ncbi:7808_t:CDS:2 [Dentiscutata erythropus]|uniref:7808_t:CDS:1 n=1 Tax=Dentiscutata erythropus TaxID=1348616 RepID=A0A9N9C803_9GLOM|nr:7808_t:CDS:2 [Dentiscutata erythropus]
MVEESNEKISINERIILNVGGIKYETYRSTLTAYPETLLGTMFQERNQSLLQPTNNNEYFFDRDGHLFRFIMQFYRTGEIFWPDESYFSESSSFYVSRRELDLELDYFQIPSPGRNGIDNFGAVTLVDSFLVALDALVDQVVKKYHVTINVNFSLGLIDYETDEDVKDIVFNILSPFKLVGYKILSKFGNEVAAYIKNQHPCLDSKISRRSNKGYFELKMSIKDYHDLDEQVVYKYSKLAKVVNPLKLEDE